MTTLSMNPQIKGSPEKEKFNLCVNIKGDKYDCKQIKSEICINLEKSKDMVSVG